MSEQDLWSFFQVAVPKGTAPDLGFPKPRGEWLLYGAAYPMDLASTHMEVSVEVLRDQRVLSQKRLRVSGARNWIDKGGGLAWPSTEIPIGPSLPLDWSFAFGGSSHSLNPRGIGDWENEWRNVHLPQIEYPEELVHSPEDRPRPAGFGAIPLEAKDRFRKAGTFGSSWYESKRPGLPEDSPPELMMSSSYDQRIEGFFKPGDVLMCKGMSADGLKVEWSIPRWKARCLIGFKSKSTDLFPLEMVVDTVILIPDKKLLVLAWRGVIEVMEPDGTDVGLVLGALESSDRPRTVSHYEELIRQRSGRQSEAVIASLDESGLLPSQIKSSLFPPIPEDEKLRLQRTQERLLDKKRSLRDGSSRLTGIPPSPQENDSANLNLDKEASVLSKKMTDLLLSPNPDPHEVAACIKQGEALSLKANEALLDKLGTLLGPEGDYKKKFKEQLAEAKVGPPQRNLNRLQASIDDVFKSGAMPRDQYEKISGRLIKLLEASSDRYRKSVHWLPVPQGEMDPKMFGEHLSVLLKEQPLAQRVYCDWVGVDLQERDLNGVNFSGAFLDGSVLRNTSLRGANFVDATLSGADLSGADLTDALLDGANLGGARLEGTILRGASCRRTIFDKAQLDRADFESADVSDATFISTRWGYASLKSANLSRAKLLGIKSGLDFDPQDLTRPKNTQLDDALEIMDLSKVDASKAEFVGCLLLGCGAEGVDMSGVDFARSSILKCNFDRANLRGSHFYATNVVLDSSFRQAQFGGGCITRSTFRGLDMHRANLQGVKLTNSDFSESNLAEANLLDVDATSSFFIRSKLNGTVFIGSKLSGAFFQSADLTDADFSQTNVDFADFTKVVVSENRRPRFDEAKCDRTELPDPFQHERE